MAEPKGLDGSWVAEFLKTLASRSAFLRSHFAVARFTHQNSVLRRSRVRATNLANFSSAFSPQTRKRRSEERNVVQYYLSTGARKLTKSEGKSRGKMAEPKGLEPSTSCVTAGSRVLRGFADVAEHAKFNLFSEIGNLIKQIVAA
jgi:hypothetical protein